ncbi:family 78 glycoside hydrolase catalytic domain [Compostimonas suwonensis]|nr:family 78 glycoside hydrolase catalytic domain [Compostimonas suwonensis]
MIAVPLLVLASVPVGAAVAADADSDLEVAGLTVEQEVNPLGVDDAQPELGWTLDSSSHDVVQSAYEIEVSTTPGGPADVWDSGEVVSSRSFDIEYAGPALDSRTRYFWRVKVWDAVHEASEWSAPAWFETSFLNQDDFAGDWIGSPNRPPAVSLAGSNWIWYPEGSPANSAPVGTRFFRTEITIPDGSDISVAQVQMSADDRFEFFVNGEPALSSPDVQDAWRTARVTDVATSLHPGTNTLAIAATNGLPGPAGVIGQLHIETAAGDVLDVTTDDSWVSADVESPGWQGPAFDDSAWPAATIGAAYGSGPWGSGVSPSTPPEPLLRHAFDVAKEVASARAYISGLGYYKLFLNGDRVGDHELDPGFTQYDKTALYATYDVTDALRNGENAIGVSLGRGYFAQLQPDEWVSSPWHDEPKLKFDLEVVYTDGTTQTVSSGTDWLASDGPTTSQSVWFGEDYDARLEQPGWNAPGFDDSAWRPAVRVDAPGGALTSQLFPAIKVTDELPEVGVTQLSPTVSVHDFGEPTAGWANVQVEGPRGGTVKIVYGEKLKADGTVNNDNVFFTVQNYNYTLKGGGPESFQPSYSYAGFRYVQVTVSDGVTLNGVSGMRLHTDVEQTGGFSSSSELLNDYQSAQANTILNNLHSVPTDTPMYEKRPYTADAFLSADSAIAIFDMQNFYESWMHTHRDDQSADGTFGNTVPGTVGSKSQTDPVWSSSYVLMSWDLYWYYGDKSVLSDNYDGLKKWMDHYEQNIAGTGGVYTGFSYADWLSPAGANAPEGTRLTATAYVYKGATTMSQIATALGLESDAAHYDELAARIADSFNTVFYDAEAGAYFDDRAAGYRQTSNLLPLSFGIVPAAQRATVLANLVKDIKDRGNHLNTGAIGTKELLPVLAENGEADLAYSVATNPSYPGWGYWFTELGATTMWEEWGDQSRSHDHAFLGTVVDWMYQDVAGIQPAAPGYSSIRIQPRPASGLTHAEGHVDSPFGEVRSEWTSADDVFTLNVRVPVGATAEVYVPANEGDETDSDPNATFTGIHDGFAVFTVGSGDYVFSTGADLPDEPTTEPTDPGTTEPTDPGTTAPTDPGTSDPTDSGTDIPGAGAGSGDGSGTSPGDASQNGDSSLAATGVPIALGGFLALLLIAAGTMAVVVRRRSKGASSN